MIDLLTESVLAKVASAVTQQKPFVLYVKPFSQTLNAIFQKDNAVHHADDFTATGFCFVSFDGTKRFLIPEQHAERISLEIDDIYISPVPRSVSVATENQKADFESLVGKGITAIQSGEMDKVVLSRVEKVALRSNFTDIFRRIIINYKMAFRYCWFHPETGLWMGATPEQLIKTDGLNFKTVALAGTQPFIDTEDVLWQEKEKAEQQFVTDFIADGLRKEVSEIHLSEPYTVRAGNLLHIKTDIGGTLTVNANLKNILEILHPTPAVCGYPKADAKKFILGNEGYNREFYSGFLGEIGNAAHDLYVNLRCMKIEEKTAHLYIGCGITKDSNPEKEFEETANKALTMKKILR